jgi:putative ABC transport system permease protein
MLAVAATVSLVSFSAGLRRSALSTYRGHKVDLVVLRAGLTERLTSNLNQAVGQRLAELPEVAAVNPSLTDMVSFGQSSLVGVPVQGWPLQSFAMRSLQIIHGRGLRPGDVDAVVFGRSLAQGLKKHAGDRVEIEGKGFQIVGVYEGTNFFDNSTAVFPLPTLQRLMDRPGQVTEFQIALRPDLPDVKTAIVELRTKIRAFKDNHGKSMGLEAMPTEEYVTASNETALAHRLAELSSLIALLIGSIGILNTMAMSVLERTQEIGALRAIGWRRSRIVRMILGESLILGLAGAVAGIAVATVLLFILSQSSVVRGWIAPELDPVVACLGLVLSVLMAIIGGLFPAYRASCCSPAEALRYE